MLAIDLRYFIIAGLTYFVFYIWLKERYHCAKIQWRYPENKHLRREIIYSMISMVISGLSAGIILWTDTHGYSLRYKNISDYGWFYYFFSIVVMIFMHDAYFYWTHRLMHWKPLFKHVHKIHHLSVNPSPFAAFAFHPVEGIVEAGIVPLIAFTLPHHLSAIIAFVTYSTLLNVMGHAGYEFFPKRFIRHWLFKWHNSSTHHNMHHSHVKYNFGLYFNFWDKAFGTNHKDYVAKFERVVTLRDEKELEQKAIAADARAARKAAQQLKLQIKEPVLAIEKSEKSEPAQKRQAVSA